MDINLFIRIRREIHFSAGGFAAKYGDKMSSVLDIKYKRPEKFEASLSGSLMGADTYVGFGNKKFSMMNGFRYKTTRLLLNSFDTKGESKPNFLDYQNYTSWRPNDHWTIDSFSSGISLTTIITLSQKTGRLNLAPSMMPKTLEYTLTDTRKITSRHSSAHSTSAITLTRTLPCHG